MSDEPRDEPGDAPIFHQCPGKMSQKAWMNILLSEGDGYDRPVAVLLYERDLHNIIIQLMRTIKAMDDSMPDSKLALHDLAERLDLAWELSVYRIGGG